MTCERRPGGESDSHTSQHIIKDYKHIFSEELRPDPALVNPLERQIDQTLWRTNNNSGPARPQTPLKEKEIERQIKKMLENKVIKESQAP